ncbi:hypothetical protein BT67DRAFT_149428 [Trichocladium antarcticum]|uniref:Uncharacterized protein n=1 Tax=Trichocladium antarcticum TaxID=1450529 RepID=A0AAN6UF18_9PEZI|nr:hypothetical protein BT67DRAFT_149428 [Trichocladium antarcticum]
MGLSSAATWTALCFKCANQCVPADARLPQTPILTPKGKFKLDKHWLGRKLERSAGTCRPAAQSRPRRCEGPGEAGACRGSYQWDPGAREGTEPVSHESPAHQQLVSAKCCNGSFGGDASGHSRRCITSILTPTCSASLSW